MFRLVLLIIIFLNVHPLFAEESLRIWTSRVGSTITARLENCDPETEIAILQRDDGKTYRVLFDQLSAFDVEYIFDVLNGTKSLDKFLLDDHKNRLNSWHIWTSLHGQKLSAKLVGYNFGQKTVWIKVSGDRRYTLSFAQISQDDLYFIQSVKDEAQEAHSARIARLRTSKESHSDTSWNTSQSSDTSWNTSQGSDFSVASSPLHSYRGKSSRVTSVPRGPYNYNPPHPNARVSVRGYYRKDGTYVRPHTRSWPTSHR